ncbi:MAG: hypothetical protein HYZ72_17380 [Deltaproteobacteria bacterium]|nr:hypothetical protein [Deltaproteobacteria bacterium]
MLLEVANLLLSGLLEVRKLLLKDFLPCLKFGQGLDDLPIRDARGDLHGIARGREEKSSNPDQGNTQAPGEIQYVFLNEPFVKFSVGSGHVRLFAEESLWDKYKLGRLRCPRGRASRA